MSTGQHAFLAPSAAHRWVHCALAPTLEASYPETEKSAAALEGTAAHWVAQQFLERAELAEVGDVTEPVGVRVTQEMRDAALLLHDEFLRTLGLSWASVLQVEKPVQAHMIHEQNWGTSDYYAIVEGPEEVTLYLWDFKFGHRLVDVFENWQLINYAFGIAYEHIQHGGRRVTIDMRIVQPRAFHRQGPVRSWRVDLGDLRGYVRRLATAAAAACEPNPKATPTPSGCKHCKGRHACEALQREAYQAADLAQEAQALDLPPQALGLELRTLARAQALLDARVSGLEAQAVAQIKWGDLVPFWALEPSQGRKAWTASSDAVLAMGQLWGVDLAKPPEAITPTQAVKAGVPKDLIDAYSARQPGAVKLTADNGDKARQIFGA